MIIIPIDEVGYTWDDRGLVPGIRRDKFDARFQKLVYNCLRQC